MISTAVIVGDISATDCANRAGKPRTFVRNPCIFCMAETSFVPALIVIVSPCLYPERIACCRPRLCSVGERLVLEQEVLIEGAELPLGVGDGDLEHPQVGVRPELDLRQGTVVVGGMGKVG